MTEQPLGGGEAQLPCPRCGSALPPASYPVMLTCPECGLAMPSSAVVELAGLVAWAGWASATADWLRARLVAGDLPAGWSVRGPSPAQRPRATPVGVPASMADGSPQPVSAAGTLLLVGGAVLLVLAGLFFVAFAWELLGPIGQLVTLYVIGAATLLAGRALQPRLAGTATALGTVGAALLAISTLATRTLAVDPLGATSALLASLLAGLVLAGAGVRLVPRMRAVGEVAAGCGAVLTLALAAFAPADGAVRLATTSWAWWLAAVLLVGGVVLLPLAHHFGVASWPPIAGSAVFLGGCVAAGFVAEQTPAAGPAQSSLACLVLLLAAAGAGALVRVLPGQPYPQWAALGLVAVAVLVAFVSGSATADVRPWAALALIGTAAFARWGRALLPASSRTALTGAAPVLLGAAVGFAAAPWGEERTRWQGLVAGAALSALLVVLSERATRIAAGHRGTSTVSLPALLAAGTGLAIWLGATESGVPSGRDEVRVAVVLCLVLLAAANAGQALRRRQSWWTVWLSACLLLAALLPASRLPGLTAGWSPEAYGLAMGLITAAAGTLSWALRRPHPTSTYLALGPASALLLLPTTLAVTHDAFARWAPGAAEASTAYQSRVVGLVIVTASLVALGAWRGWGGIVVPAAAALLIVACVQLIDLGRFLPQWMSFAAAGALLVLAGARWERFRTLGQRGSSWLRALH